jgi:hypothetical protein
MRALSNPPIMFQMLSIKYRPNLQYCPTNRVSPSECVTPECCMLAFSGQKPGKKFTVSIKQKEGIEIPSVDTLDLKHIRNYYKTSFWFVVFNLWFLH